MSIDWKEILIITAGMASWVATFLLGYWKGHKDARIIWHKAMEELGSYFRQIIR